MACWTLVSWATVVLIALSGAANEKNQEIEGILPSAGGTAFKTLCPFMELRFEAVMPSPCSAASTSSNVALSPEVTSIEYTI